MKVSAKLRHLRIAPRKVRLVADLIRGKSADDAQAILNFTVKRAAKPLLKLLNSAIANAKNNFHLDVSNLYISIITVDEGPKIKRWMPRARGSAYEIHKKTSHVNLVLQELKKSKRAAKVKKKKSPKLADGTAAEDSVRTEKIKGRERPKLKPAAEIKKPAPSAVIKRIFRRKSF